MKVRQFVFNHVPDVEECDDGAWTVGRHQHSPTGHAGIRTRPGSTANFTSSGGRKQLHVDEQIQASTAKRPGTLRVQGQKGGATNCDTGRDHWRAKHGA